MQASRNTDTDTAPRVQHQALPAALCARWWAALAESDAQSRPLVAVHNPAADAVLHAITASPLRTLIERRLGPAPLCNLSQSWVRHGRPPHSWHQDGALRFDFMAHAGRVLPADALLEMLTCWIALTPCGQHAPGLEWVNAAQPGLLPPADLRDEAVAARHAAHCFQRPLLLPGDAVLFDGQLLHRTHLTPEMTQARCSLELRFFRGGTLPARLAADLLVPLR